MPAAAVAIPAVISAGASVGQMISGNKLAKQAKKDIDNYQRQDLVNPNERIQASTLGTDRQREDLARNIATMANNVALGGSRAMLGFAPSMIEQNMQQNAQIAANLDQQQMQIELRKAQGDAMVQQMQEQREQQDLAGLGNMWNTGRQEAMNGVNNLVQTGISTAQAFAGMENGGSASNSNAEPRYDRNGLIKAGNGVRLSPFMGFNPAALLGLNMSPYQTNYASAVEGLNIRPIINPFGS